jgi:hypothetical protein
MPRDGAIIFSDLIGKLDMLRVGPKSNLKGRPTRVSIETFKAIVVAGP